VAVAISRDERFAAAAGTNGVRIYDARTGEELPTVRTMPVPEGNSTEAPNITALTNVTALAINPQGTQILAGTQDGQIALYDLMTGAEIAVWKNRGGRAINSLAYNSTGTRAVSADSSNRVIVWTTDGEQVQSFSADRAVAYFWPLDEEVVISAGRDNLITAWDIPRGVAVKRILSEVALLSLALSPDGAYALTGGGGTAEGAGARVALWELGTINREAQDVKIPSAVIEPLRLYSGHTGEASQSQGVAFAADGELVVSAGSEGRLLVWDRDTGDLLTAFTVSGDADLRALAISDDGQQALSGGETDGTAVLRLWDLRSASVVTDMRGHTGRTVGVFVPQPDGIARTILTGGVDDDPRNPDDDDAKDNLRVFDIASGRTIQQLRGHEDLIVDVDISPDGRLAVSGSADLSVRVWDLANGTGQIVGRHNSPLRDVAFMPDGESVVAISRGGQIIRWNARGENDALHTYVDPAGPERSLQALAVSRDGHYLLTGSDSRIVKLWDADSGDMLQTYEIEDRAVRALAFSPDGSKIIIGSVNGSLTLFETDGDLIRTLAGHSRAVLSASFTDENTLLSTAFDNTMRVWDLASGFEVRRFDTSDEPTISLNTAAISPDGQLVMTGLSDGRVRVWRLYPTLDRLLAWTRANRDITPLPDCDMREQFNLDPCDANGLPPPFQWPDLPALNPLPESVVTLQPEIDAYINTTAGDGQRVRPAPGMDNAPLEVLADGALVTVVDGPQSASGLWWWQIEAEGGLTGWVSEYIPEENIQSLVPVSALE
jgi:WD40 repeat protein